MTPQVHQVSEKFSDLSERAATPSPASEGTAMDVAMASLRIRAVAGRAGG